MRCDSRNQRCIVIKAQEPLENLREMKYKMNLYGCWYLDTINNKFAQPKSAFLMTSEEPSPNYKHHMHVIFQNESNIRFHTHFEMFWAMIRMATINLHNIPCIISTQSF